MAVDSPTAFDDAQPPMNKLVIEPEEEGEDDDEEEKKDEKEKVEEPVMRNASLSMAKELAEDEETKAVEDED